MVGRAGRSKGCFDCRRRKKGCDLSRPHCDQCIKRKTRCTGYDDTLDVVVYTPPASKFIYTPPASKSHASLESTAMQIKYIDTFWELLLPTMSRASRSPNGGWTQVIRDHYTADGPFKNAMLALTLSRVGQYSGNADVARSGAIHYTNCLREVARKIDIQRGACNDELLAVCMILGLYEVMCSPTAQGINWQHHISGVGILMQLRGPHEFTYGISHALFVGARMDVIFGALISRKATFLDSHEWTTVPWSTPKSIYDKVVDLCAQVPRVLEMLDQLHIARPQPAANSESLLKACWRLDNELQDWYREFVATCNDLRHIHPNRYASRAPDFDQPLTAETEINYEHAQALSVYWIACSFVHTILRLLWQACDNPVYLLPHRIDPLRYASLISKSLPYFSAPSAGEGSMLYYAMSIGTALHCFSVSNQLCSPDAYRITNGFYGLEDPTGIGVRVGLFLRTLAAASVKPHGKLDKATRDDIAEFGKRWWGGGREKVTLRPRTPVGKADKM
ncbi:uncharacterized protein CC84DRAFT_1165223 [Paraphaeosphaeria sporulosa]|uniref:Zn(2)-C6 fungal-type domain-containing protein n=1 Tax=Paraphaeosphaeria sporulosa TaxID=1460663 RepID=A0A177CB96_9PLEO|nr:uncharacterized protein CC84DRAFT_1165223 [Paraphaeosphaeria sporulosa]OAG04845.1 hypothetical protein CC84DRAFT_1165223 [Paraphaeosphaeria sporulosa]